jgi:hypothetical protein
MNLSKTIKLFDSNSIDEKAVIVKYIFTEAKSRLGRDGLDPTDYSSVEIIRFTDNSGKALNKKWSAIADEWASDIYNLLELQDYALDDLG